MAEYIEREALIKFIEDGLNNPDETQRFGHDAVKILAEVEFAPAADVEPVKHGRWKYYKKQGVAVCTECSFERNLNDNFGAAVSCPNCGAKMDKEA